MTVSLRFILKYIIFDERLNIQHIMGVFLRYPFLKQLLGIYLKQREEFKIRFCGKLHGTENILQYILMYSYHNTTRKIQRHDLRHTLSFDINLAQRKFLQKVYNMIAKYT